MQGQAKIGYNIPTVVASTEPQWLHQGQQLKKKRRLGLMDTKVYLLKVDQHPEIKHMMTAGGSLESVTRLYISTHSIPENLVESIVVTDWDANSYSVVLKR